MATIEGLKPHLYILRDFILPTAEHTLAVCPPTQFENWVQAILGQVLGNCNPSDEQCNLVLQLALLYQFFLYKINEPGAV
ncbi:hypothetical protein C8Q76DRAFT_798467 [Earliella scabrosa]|nr:hypothetical protein C8Q76DRAFT_798467 [Earliella scabrosa]